jgi:hypothetical protein
LEPEAAAGRALAGELTKRHLVDPVVLASPGAAYPWHRGAAIVRAPDEKTARELAQSAFGMATRFRHHPRLVPPWTRAKLVHASHIEDQRFDPEGPRGVLVPSFEADLAARPKTPVPVAHEAPATEPSGKRATRDTLKFLAKIRSTLRSEPSLGQRFHPSELELGSDGVLVLGGEVESVKAKKLALERVAALPGIAGIADRLHVTPATHMSDKEIRSHMRDMLMEEASFQWKRPGEDMPLPCPRARSRHRAGLGALAPRLHGTPRLKGRRAVQGPRAPGPPRRPRRHCRA